MNLGSMHHTVEMYKWKDIDWIEFWDWLSEKAMSGYGNVHPAKWLEEMLSDYIDGDEDE